GGMGGGMGGGGGRHGGGGFGRGGGGSPDGDAEANGGDSDNGQQQQRGPSPFARVMHPAKKVVIEMLADEVKVSEDEMEARPYAISDSLKAHQHDLVTENTSAAWKGNDLVMTQSLGQRGSLVEAYELSADGKTLTITAHREGGPSGNPNPTIKRVYTRYEGD
ncbi:MAG TPA: hypothetical protein VMH61_02145, partial [Candidatus Acidoferrales bacterium]|nr:hypothetical protein [Candidatus Acidoferrales bacterium]